MRKNYLVISATLVLLMMALMVPILIGGQSEIRKAEAAMNDKDFEMAADSYARAARIHVWRTGLWEMAGLAAFSGSSYSDSVTYLRHATHLTEEGWVALSFAYLNLGDTTSAEASFEEGLKQFPRSAPLWAGLGGLHRIREDWSAERQALQTLVELSPVDAGIHYRLGLLLMLSIPDQAEAELKMAKTVDPAYDPAVQTLLAALEQSQAHTDPASQQVTIGRGLGLVGEWKLSISAFETAISSDPQNGEAWAWLGEAKQQLGQDGRLEMDRALDLDRTSASIRGLRGLYWSRQDRPAQMLAEFLLAAEYEPKNPAWQASIGDAHLRRGDLVSALRAYQHAVVLAQDDPAYWRLLAVFCAENGVHVEDIGLPAAQKAVDLSPEDPLTLDALGYSFYSSGRFASAEQTFNQVIELAPDFLPAQIHLAMNYLAQGDQRRAHTILLSVKDADPQGPYGSDAGQLLERYFK